MRFHLVQMVRNNNNLQLRISVNSWSLPDCHVFQFLLRMFAIRIGVVYSTHCSGAGVTMDYIKRKRGGKGPLQWEQSYRLLDVVRVNPSITAEQLQMEGASIGIEISTRTAFRFLERYRSTKGDIVKSFRPHLQVVANVMRDADPDFLFTASIIQEKALEQGVSLHLSTVYRILRRLVSTGTAVQTEIKGVTFYTWKRETSHHGHVKCVMCGRTVEFQKDYLDGLARNICASFDFEFEAFDLTLLAKCKHCLQFVEMEQ